MISTTSSMCQKLLTDIQNNKVAVIKLPPLVNGLRSKESRISKPL